MMLDYKIIDYQPDLKESTWVFLAKAFADYVYYVPYLETEDEIFLKTIIPSRKATKKYLENKNE